MWTTAAPEGGTSGPPHTQAPPSGFAFPEDPAEGAELLARNVAEALDTIYRNVIDARCQICVLGPVSAVLPRMSDALAERGVALAGVRGVWCLPPSVVDSLGSPDWLCVLQRLKPYLLHDLSRELAADLFAGRAVDWQAMALDAGSVVVVKHTPPWRHLGTNIARRSFRAVRSGAARRAAVRAARTHLRPRRLASLASWLWPFRWSWLLGWALGVALLVGSRLLAQSIVQAHIEAGTLSPRAGDPPAGGAAAARTAGWRELVALAFGNLTVFAYALKGRAPYDKLMDEALGLKLAGSAALRLGQWDAAAQQYTAAARRAADVRVECWWLNWGSSAAADALRGACCNNAAAVHLKTDAWADAAAACTEMLGLGLADRVANAKAHYRRAVALASLGDVGEKDAFL